MAVRQDITEAHLWYIGEDKVLEIEVLQNDGKALTDPTKLPDDVTGRTLVWTMSKTNDPASAPIIQKRTGGQGITIVGVFASTRAANTQRVHVAVEDIDTDTLKPLKPPRQFSLKAIDPDNVLTVGDATLLKSTAPAE